MKKLKSLSFILMLSVAFILGSCLGEDENPCPDALFTITVDSTDFSYTFTADNVEDLIYGWYVNGQLVETEDIDSLRDNIFNITLDSGEYTVCIKGESQICGGSVEFCLPVSIDRLPGEDDDCPDLRFDVYRLGEREFKFLAEFEGRDSIEYSWVVDGDTVLTEELGTERLHKLVRALEPGVHEVCILAHIEGCGVISFCKGVNTEENEEGCPELHFEYGLDDAGNFVFEADFAGMDSTQYKWYVNGEKVDAENFEGHETDHKLFKHFGPGTYEVCIKNYREGCPEAYCETIHVEGEACPELFFHTEDLGDGSFVFEADFMNQAITPYKWYVNGDFVEAENFEGDTTDNRLEKTFAPGTYNVCIKSYAEGCEGTLYCEEIKIEGESTTCREVGFHGERDGVNLAYIFIADFEGRDEVNYEWYVLVDGEWKGGESRHAGSEDDHMFTWQFDIGVVYEVCLKQEGCGDSRICKEFVIN